MSMLNGGVKLPNISVIKKTSDGQFYIRITRHNGTSYRVLSEDRQSIQEYQTELLAAIEKKQQRGR